MLTSKINVGLHVLAVLPVDYLSRRGCPCQQVCNDQVIDPVYQDVFRAGIKAYQLVIYRQLLGDHYGRGVASQIATYQHRMIAKEADGRVLNDAVNLIGSALDSRAVTADTHTGAVEIPIEMNVALSLLLGVKSSPHYANHPDERAVEIASMDMDIDWILSRCLTRARKDMQDVFTPLLACIDSGVRIDYVEAYLNDRLVAL